MINGCSLFSNVGIDETYFKENGVEIKVANELLEKRANFYRHLYPTVNMICGDITDKKVFNEIVAEYKKNNCDFLIATPPCQGMSVAGKRDKQDKRNFLITYVIEFIKQTKPSNIIIENVPQILKTYIEINNKKTLIVDYIKDELGKIFMGGGRTYFINYSVLDACNYDTPQYRKRAIFLISKIKQWEFPKKSSKTITVKDAIGDLPSLESGEKSNIKYHYAKIHNEREISWLKHTPTGKTALDNEIYYPKRLDGGKIKCFHSCYQRLNWDKPATTITMNNGSISSQSNGHPGRLLKNGTYSDARVLTILELLRLTGLPDDWNIPEWASDNLIRQVIGECLPPKFANALLTTMPHNAKNKYL